MSDLRDGGSAVTLRQQLTDTVTAATPGPWECTRDEHGRGEVDVAVWSNNGRRYITECVGYEHETPDRREADAALAAMAPCLAAALLAVLNLPEQDAQNFSAVGYNAALRDVRSAIEGALR